MRRAEQRLDGWSDHEQSDIRKAAMHCHSRYVASNRSSDALGSLATSSSSRSERSRQRQESGPARPVGRRVRGRIGPAATSASAECCTLPRRQDAQRPAFPGYARHPRTDTPPASARSAVMARRGRLPLQSGPGRLARVSRRLRDRASGPMVVGDDATALCRPGGRVQHMARVRGKQRRALRRVARSPGAVSRRVS